MPIEPNDAQKDILKVIAESEQGINTYQVTVALRKESSAVINSVQLLAERGFLRIEKPTKGVAKPLLLTDKGAWYAIKHRADYELTFKNHPYLITDEGREIVRRLKQWKIDEDYIETWTDLVIDNNLFEDSGESTFKAEKIGNFRFQHYRKTLFINLSARIASNRPQLGRLLQFTEDEGILTAPEIKILEKELPAS